MLEPKRLFGQVLSLLVLLASASIAGAQPADSRTIAALTTPDLEHKLPLKDMFRYGKPISHIGGVQFETMAAPRRGLTITSLKINYDPDATDGQRFSVSINGVTAKTNLPDWQLLPIARFADSEFLACVTLFGDLSNHELDRRFKRAGHQVINFHPALVFAERF